jgi:hypothetical protein
MMENADVERNMGMECILGKMVRCSLDPFVMASSMDTVSYPFRMGGNIEGSFETAVCTALE